MNWKLAPLLKPLLSLATAGCLAVSAHAVEVRGAGASFPSSIYTAWAGTFEKERGVKVTYAATGSGDGVKRIVAREVDFAGTDSPLGLAELEKHQLLQFPSAIGGIVPVVNVRGVGNNRLQLSGGLLADIMRGAVTHWNDPRIAELNPGLSLPRAPIVRIVRADRSGTTEAFTRYLSSLSTDWATQAGHGQQVRWPGTPSAVEGNDGVAKAVAQTDGAIGYVSHDRVSRHGLAGVKLRNRHGVAVAASEEGFRAAVQASDLNKKGDETASLLDQSGISSWPITVTTYLLIDARPPSSEKSGPTLQFLYWAFLKGDPMARAAGFAPLPTAIQARFVPRFQKVRARNGDPLNFYVE